MKKKFTAMAIIAIVITTITPAHAADTGYRYWGYFQAAPKATTWTPAMTGPTVDVADGAVEGWAFTFSSEAVPMLQHLLSCLIFKQSAERLVRLSVRSELAS